MKQCRRFIKKVFETIIRLCTTSTIWVGFPDFLDTSFSEKSKLFQIHHQDKIDGSSEMMAQSEISLGGEMLEWQKEIAERHPLPDGKQWLICNEESEHFVLCANSSYNVDI